MLEIVCIQITGIQRIVREQPVNRDAANAAAITAVSNVFLFIIVPPLFRPRALICILRFLSRLRSVLPDPLIALS